MVLDKPQWKTLQMDTRMLILDGGEYYQVNLWCYKDKVHLVFSEQNLCD